MDKRNIPSSSEEKPLLLVFARAPKLGMVKQRMAQKLGKQTALRIYESLLLETATLANQISFPVCVYWAAEQVPPQHAFRRKIRHALQTTGHLGKRMQQAFGEAFASGHTPVLIIGSDCPDLQPTSIYEARLALRKYPYVIGPCSDGGYYLFGMRNYSTQPFEAMPWGSHKLREQTQKRLGVENCYLLDELKDMDRPEDLASWKNCPPLVADKP